MSPAAPETIRRSVDGHWWPESLRASGDAWGGEHAGAGRDRVCAETTDVRRLVGGGWRLLERVHPA